jgi:hypothetical protein
MPGKTKALLITQKLKSGVAVLETESVFSIIRTDLFVLFWARIEAVAREDVECFFLLYFRQANDTC